MIHHDLSKVEGYFDDIILINKALFGAGSVEDVFTPEIMEAAFKTPLSLLETMGVKG